MWLIEVVICLLAALRSWLCWLLNGKYLWPLVKFCVWCWLWYELYCLDLCLSPQHLLKQLRYDRAQANSPSYPPWDGKWVVAYGLCGEGLVWLIGAVVCLLAANYGSSCSLTLAMDGCIVCCGIISSCQSTATSEVVKALLATSSSHKRSAIASTGLYL